MTPLEEAARSARIAKIRATLAKTKGNVSAASRLLGLATPQVLFRALRRYGIEWTAYREKRKETP